MIPVHKTDHVEEGLALLIEQFRGKPRIEAMLASYLEEGQEFEDAAWGVITKRLLENATDAQLVTVGKIVGQPPVGANDDEFRIYIQARIATNMSDGLIDDVANVAALLFPVEFDVIAYYPCAIVLVLLEPVDEAPRLQQDLIQKATAAGVRFDIHFSSEPLEDCFYFGGGPGWGAPWIGAVSDHTL